MADQVPEGRQPRLGDGLDATTLLTFYVVLLLAIPSPLVVATLGSAGSPSTILAIGTFFLWTWFQVRRDEPASPAARPLRTAALVWLLLMAVVYVHAMASPLPVSEVSPADNGMLKVVGLCGLVLLAGDGIATGERLRALTRRLVLGAGLIAGLGLLQDVTRQVFVDRIAIPGLTSSGANLILSERSGLVRPSGTSTHPIEYGVVLTMLFPLAITYAQHATSRRWLYRSILAVLSIAIFLSISRSAILCAVVALLVLSVRWSWTVRLWALGGTVVTAAAVYVARPGVLGTFRQLFLGIDSDTSVASRTNSYAVAAQFIERQLLLGRGFGTFLPDYWILDNGYLGLLIEGGVVGLAGLLVLIVVASSAAGRAHRTGTSELDRALGQGLLAAVLAGACSLALFDTFAFPQSAGCFFLLLGLCGAARRLAGEPAPTSTGLVRRPALAAAPGGDRHG